MLEPAHHNPRPQSGSAPSITRNSTAPVSQPTTRPRPRPSPGTTSNARARPPPRPLPPSEPRPLPGMSPLGSVIPPRPRPHPTPVIPPLASANHQGPAHPHTLCTRPPLQPRPLPGSTPTHTHMPMTLHTMGTLAACTSFLVPTVNTSPVLHISVFVFGLLFLRQVSSEDSVCDLGFPPSLYNWTK